MDDLKKLIRDVPDFPKPGIIFKDVTPLLQSPEGLREVVKVLAERYAGERIDKVIGIESRGFIFGAPLALRMGIGFVPVRKAGKLPWTKISQEYVLEYGKDRIEIHADALKPAERVLVVDDLLATGGTAQAVCHLVEKMEARVAGVAFVVELDFLNGRDKLQGRDIFSIIHY